MTGLGRFWHMPPRKRRININWGAVALAIILAQAALLAYLALVVIPGLK